MLRVLFVAASMALGSGLGVFGLSGILNGVPQNIRAEWWVDHYGQYAGAGLGIFVFGLVVGILTRGQKPATPTTTYRS